MSDKNDCELTIVTESIIPLVILYNNKDEAIFNENKLKELMKEPHDLIFISDSNGSISVVRSKIQYFIRR